MIFSSEIMQKFSIIFEILLKNKLMISTAESCTGGLLSSLFTELDGSSKIFDRGFVVYSNQSKIAELQVAEDLINKYGAVSQEVATAMVQGALKNSNANISIAITGIAGPNGGSPQKPVGTIFIAIATKQNMICQKFLFGNDRQLNRYKTILETLNLLEIFLKENDSSWH